MFIGTRLDGERVGKLAEPSTYSCMPADHQLVTGMRDATQTLAVELGVEQRELLNIVKSMADYQENLVDGLAFSGQQGIADLVKLNGMVAYSVDPPR